MKGKRSHSSISWKKKDTWLVVAATLVGSICALNWMDANKKYIQFIVTFHHIIHTGSHQRISMMVPHKWCDGSNFWRWFCPGYHSYSRNKHNQKKMLKITQQQTGEASLLLTVARIGIKKQKPRPGGCSSANLPGGAKGPEPAVTPLRAAHEAERGLVVPLA